MKPIDRPWERLRAAHLEKLTATVPSREIGLSPDMTSAATVHAITQLMQDEPLRVAGSRR